MKLEESVEKLANQPKGCYLEFFNLLNQVDIPFISPETKTGLVEYARHEFGNMQTIASSNLEKHENRIFSIMQDKEITSKSPEFKEICSELGISQQKLYSVFKNMEKKDILLIDKKENLNSYKVNFDYLDKFAISFLGAINDSLRLKHDISVRLHEYFVEGPYTEKDIELANRDLCDELVVPFFKDFYKKNKFPAFLDIPFMIIPDQAGRLSVFLEAIFNLGMHYEDRSYITLNPSVIERMSFDLLECDLWVMREIEKMKKIKGGN